MKLKFLLFIIFPAINLFPQFDSDTLNKRYLPVDSLMTDSVSADTTGLLSDSLKISRRDSLSFMTQSPFYPGSYFIPNRKMLFMDYRYAGDFLEAFPFTFTLDKGFVGQRNEVLIYGAGFNSISYFQDGVLVNDRSSNSLDLNHIQSEALDSIEIIPAPRGFLYGPYNNPVSINFITKDFIPKVPYSRIKYYEGPFGEAMFDGIFSAMLFRKMSFFADITNRKTDRSFRNSSFSIWQAGTRLKYLVSENLNISGNYNFVHSETGFNGGIDVDSILRITSDIDSLLYNETLAPVVYPNGLQKGKQHHFNVRTLFNPVKNLESDLNLYYKFYLDESENTQSLNASVKSKVSGLALKESYRIGIFNPQINFNYEHYNLLIKERNRLDSMIVPLQVSNYQNIFSISPIISLVPFDSNLVLSVFYKHNNRTIQNSSSLGLNGGGIDIIYMPGQMLKWYFGYSKYETLNFGNVYALEVAAKLSVENSFIQINYYKRNIFDNGDPFSISGIGIGAEINFWKILLESQLNIPGKETLYNRFRMRGGLFYKDALFDSSLNLKTGFAFHHFNQEKDYLYLTPVGRNSAQRIDFTLSGEIQKTAIVYFAWENLLNEEYYLVPFYPMPERSIRFGISWEILN